MADHLCWATRCATKREDIMLKISMPQLTYPSSHNHGSVKNGSPSWPSEMFLGKLGISDQPQIAEQPTKTLWQWRKKRLPYSRIRPTKRLWHETTSKLVWSCFFSSTPTSCCKKLRGNTLEFSTFDRCNCGKYRGLGISLETQVMSSWWWDCILVGWGVLDPRHSQQHLEPGEGLIGRVFQQYSSGDDWKASNSVRTGP